MLAEAAFSSDHNDMKKEQYTYDELSDSAKFREQFRFAFAGVIVATVFVIPDGDILTTFLKGFLAISAFLSGVFLIFSAARVKYVDPGRMYEVLYVSERFRMRMFDWSLDIFGFAFLYFISLFLTGLVDKIPGVELGEAWTWIVAIVILLATGFAAFMIGCITKSRELKKKLPEL